MHPEEVRRRASISVMAARSIIQAAAVAPSLSHEEHLMVEDLELTGVPIAETPRADEKRLPKG